MPLQATSGAASYDAFGGGAAAVPNYIEEVFSTYLYTGTGATQTITNGIDLSGKGGLTWIKSRSAVSDNALYDTARGATFDLVSNSSGTQTTQATGLTSFGSTGFSIGALAKLNTSAATYASWTFRKQPKFFDVVTYTGTGANRTIAHNLGSVPGCIMVKRLDVATDSWRVYHRSLANTEVLALNASAAKSTDATAWNSTTPTSTVFSIGTNTAVNDSSSTYVAYIFAHNAGGFGLTGTDNVISCGTFTSTAGGGASVTLGYEPQWILFKRSDSSTGGSWNIIDNMRGWGISIANPVLLAQSTAAESTLNSGLTATGFEIDAGYLAASAPFIYIAIRRGPMKVPTSGTSVFSPIKVTATTNTKQTTNFSVDTQFLRSIASGTPFVADRLRQVSTTNDTAGEKLVETSAASAEVSNTTLTNGFDNTGFKIPSSLSNTNALFLNFVRAPNFFDVVCYTGTGVARTVAHNLAVVPELMFVKGRSGATAWQIYSGALANTEYLVLNSTAAKATGATRWNSTTPTSTVFSLGTASEVNTSSATYVTHLFASCPSVSKVGSYTGTGATQVINCGFAGGARFILIKATSSTGNWLTWDSARGIVAGNDPYLTFNSTAAEVTNTDWVDTAASGFELSNAGGNLANSSGVSYIFLAIA